MPNKKLHLKYPFITPHPAEANLLSIFSRDEEIVWLLNHLIMLSDSAGCVDGSLVDNHVDFDIARYPLQLLRNCPLVYLHALSKTYIDVNYENVTEFIINAINDGYYVYLYAETTCIKAYCNFDVKNSYGHDLLVYGYDTDQKVFNIADFFVSKYSYETCSFDEMANAYNKSTYNFYENSVFLIKKSNKYQSCINIASVRQLLEDYINKKNTSNLIDKGLHFHDHKRFSYGLGIYDSFANSIENNSVELRLLIKNIHIMYDHKILMIKLIKQLSAEGYLFNYEHINEQMQNLANKILAFRNIAVKFYVKNEIDKASALDRLSNIAQSDAEVFVKLYESLAQDTIPLNHELPSIKCQIKILYEDRITGKGKCWAHNYGKEGYYIVGHPVASPNNIKFRICDAKFILHAEADHRALITPDTESLDGAGVLYNFDKFNIDFYVKYPTKITLYYYNYERDNKCFYIEFIDIENKEKVLEYQPIDFNEGLYTSFLMNGYIRLNFKSIGDAGVYTCPILCAIFFDAVDCENSSETKTI